MAGRRSLKSLAVIIILVVHLLSCFVINSEARPLKDEKIESSNAMKELLNGLMVEAIKTGGPSNGGHGHESTNALTLEEIKRSGPSPGQGN